MRKWPTILLLLAAWPIAAAQKINWEEIEWQLLKTQHFDVYFPEGYNHLGQKTAEYAEAANILLSEKLKHRLSMVTPIFVYPSHGHFQSTNIIPFAIDEGTGGFTERIKRRVVVPYLGSNDEFRHVVVHELVHAFQYDILLGQTMGSSFSIVQGGQPPLWFVEGMAEYFSLGWDHTADMQMRDAALTDTFPTLEMMTEYRVQTGFIFYKGGQSVMQYIAETYGENKIGEMLRDLRDLRGIEDAVKTNLGITFEDFDAGWRRWVKRKYFPLVNKKYDDEEGPLLTRHLNDESLINLHPAISPDGSKAVYLTARGFYPVMVMRDIKDVKLDRDYTLNKKKDPTEDEKILLKSSDNPTFFQLHLMTNRITFTPDSKRIFFSARSQGKDRLILFDIEKREIVQRL
ncbi:MAG TPA: basic secretory protein-like protein, partial [Turneriella sp.]|nr:basic secretory protein-like protein [Turneriella sp.]